MYNYLEREEFHISGHWKTHKTKKAIFICSWVHPGESNASFVVEGIMKFLLGSSEEATLLWENFVFKIVPMLNPDGVIYGHYRTSLLGVDLNRRWKAPNWHLHPSIFYSKEMITSH